jgi:hypothetical protein
MNTRNTFHTGFSLSFTAAALLRLRRSRCAVN